MKDNIKHSGLVFLSLIIVWVMSAILSITFSMIASVAFSGGYNAVVVDKNGKKVDSYTYKLEQKEDTKKIEFEKQGYIVNKAAIVTKKGEVFEFVCNTFCTVSILIVFVYNRLYKVGNKDFNLVKFNHKSQDKLRGLKIGAIASIPNFLLYVAIVVLKFVRPSTSIGLYIFPNFQYYNILNAIMQSKTRTLANVTALDFVYIFLTLLIVPIVCYASYTLGYKDVNLSDKLTYKKGEIKK